MTTLVPQSSQEVAAMLKDANAHGHAVSPRGGGTKTSWGNPATRCDFILSTAHLNQVVEHAWADLTVTVQAGCTIANLQKTLAEHGQRLAVDPLWPEQATIGGVLSTNDTGVIRLYFGGLRDLIIGATIALADGTLAESGGKVVKNVAGYDLPKLMTGALGTLGVITQAVFRLHPLPHNSKTLTAQFPSVDEAEAFVLSVQGSRLAHTALQIRIGDGIHADILIEGTEAGIDAQEAVVSKLAPSLAATSAPVWQARQELWNREGAIAKFSVLPAHLAAAIETIGRVGPGEVVVQATGLGFFRTTGPSAAIADLRSAFERRDGSLVVLRQPSEVLETWGKTGDTLPLMKALKQQFDPKGTLNPGRFVGGI